MSTADQLTSGYYCNPYIYQNDLWMQTGVNGAPLNDFRIGGGGVMATLRDIPTGYLSLLIPPDEYPDQTDAVIQDVFWSTGVENPDPSSAYVSAYPMLNINQAGNNDNTFNPIQSVNVIKSSCAIDVVSIAYHEWIDENQSYWTAKFPMLTHYQIVGAGVIKVRTVELVGSLSLTGGDYNGKITQGPQTILPGLQIVSWLPFSALYTGIAYHISPSTGLPDWYYSAADATAGKVSGFTAQSTNGYSVLFLLNGPQQNLAMGVAFGTRELQCIHSQGPANCDASGNGLSAMGAGSANPILLPNFNYLGDVPMGTIIDKSYYLVPMRGMSASTDGLMQKYSAEAGSPTLIFPDATPNSEIQSIATQLQKALMQFDKNPNSFFTEQNVGPITTFNGQ